MALARLGLCSPEPSERLLERPRGAFYASKARGPPRCRGAPQEEGALLASKKGPRCIEPGIDTIPIRLRRELASVLELKLSLCGLTSKGPPRAPQGAPQGASSKTMWGPHPQLEYEAGFPCHIYSEGLPRRQGGPPPTRAWPPWATAAPDADATKSRTAAAEGFAAMSKEKQVGASSNAGAAAAAATAAAATKTTGTLGVGGVPVDKGPLGGPPSKPGGGAPFPKRHPVSSTKRAGLRACGLSVSNACGTRTPGAAKSSKQQPSAAAASGTAATTVMICCCCCCCSRDRFFLRGREILFFSSRIRKGCTSHVAGSVTPSPSSSRCSSRCNSSSNSSSCSKTHSFEICGTDASQKLGLVLLLEVHSNHRCFNLRPNRSFGLRAVAAGQRTGVMCKGRRRILTDKERGPWGGLSPGGLGGPLARGPPKGPLELLLLT
ncbi:hypothetical protein Emag_006909 [Eimeria magna]